MSNSSETSVSQQTIIFGIIDSIEDFGAKQLCNATIKFLDEGDSTAAATVFNSVASALPDHLDVYSEFAKVDWDRIANFGSLEKSSFRATLVEKKKKLDNQTRSSGPLPRRAACCQRFWDFLLPSGQQQDEGSSESFNSNNSINAVVPDE